MKSRCKATSARFCRTVFDAVKDSRMALSQQCLCSPTHLQLLVDLAAPLSVVRTARLGIAMQELEERDLLARRVGIQLLRKI
jgi:hypothetical protein